MDSKVGIVPGVVENIGIQGLLGVTVSYVELGGRLEVWVVMGNCHIPVMDLLLILLLLQVVE